MDPVLKILIVEDNPGDVIIVNELIRSSGIYSQTQHATTLQESIELCKKNEFDIILLDLGLPDSLGLNTLKQLHAARSNSPLVVMTGLDDEDIALQALREGAQDYLVKNRLTSDIILRAIKYSIERKKIDDVTRLNGRRFSILSKATGALNESDDEAAIFRIICASISTLLDNAGVIAIDIIEKGRFRLSGIEWIKPHFRTIKNITGIDLNNPVHEISEDLINMSFLLGNQTLKEIEGGIAQAFNGLMNTNSGKQLEDILAFKRLYTIGFQQHKYFYGAFLIMTNNEVSDDDKRIIETISNQTALNFHRRNIERYLRLSEERYRKLTVELEQKVKERTSDLVMVNKQLHKELSDRIMAEKALKKNEVELKELNATKDKFFNIVAHDLKNPFTSLLGSTELLFQNLDKLDPENIRKLAIILNDSAKSGYAILLNLLDWSRSQTGLLKINPEAINLKDIVEENIANLELFATNKNISVKSDIASGLKIFADQNMVNSILRNLISNALKFSFRSGEVTIKARSTENEVTVSIKDNGKGIPVEHLDKLFRIDTRYSMPGTENEQGTGLGLKLCKEFVEKQGGHIWVESELNKGTEFIFVIPSA